MGLKYKCVSDQQGFSYGVTYEVQAIVSEATVMFLNDDGRLVAVDVSVLNDDECFELVLEKAEPKEPKALPAPTKEPDPGSEEKGE